MKERLRRVEVIADRTLGAAYAAVDLGRHSRCTGYPEWATVALADARIDQIGRWRSPVRPFAVEVVAEYVNWAEGLAETGSGCWARMGTSAGYSSGK